MKFKKLLTCLILSAFLINFSGVEAQARKKKSKKKYFTAQAAILLDARSNKIIYGRNVHMRLLPASTAKIMTALLALERLDLEQYVSASAHACSREPSKIYLNCAARYKVKDLLHAVLMGSANDASACIAEAVSGTESDFAELMTKRAKQLGCKNTKFVNASGLPSKQSQYSSVYDLVLIMRKLVKFPLAVDIMSDKSYTFQDSEGRSITVNNHNKLLWKFPGKAIGKTGYTRKARHCFVGNDLVKNKEVVFAVLKSSSLWFDVQYLLRLAGCIK